jgi:hypothetical protein
MFAKESPDKLWDAWTLAAFHAQVALERWYAAPSGRKSDAFATYHAALDREERAAVALASSLAPSVGERLRSRMRQRQRAPLVAVPDTRAA